MTGAQDQGTRTASTGDVGDVLPRNFLKASLLLLAREGPTHGYGLLDRLRSLGMKDPEPGNLYRALRALERQGLMRSVWETSTSGPPRRTYEITTQGEQWLDACARNLEKTRSVLDDYLARYEQFAATY